MIAAIAMTRAMSPQPFPKASVKRATNHFPAWASADSWALSMPVGTDIGLVENTMLETMKDLAKDPKWRTRIIDKPEVWGRPVGITQLQDGSLLVVEDGNGTIWKISYTGT